MENENPNDQLRRLLSENSKEKRKQNKYGNQHVEVDGVKYDSLSEYRYKCKLDVRKRLGEIEDYAYHVPIPLIAAGGELVGHYVADFIVNYPDWRREIHDIKGGGKELLTDIFKWKVRHVKVQYGEDVIIIDSKTLLPKK